MIERLALDHEEIDEHWAKLNEVLREQIADPARFLDLTARFEKHLRTHIERENLDFFPVLVKMLSPDQLAGIGQRMARLRQ
ncbi:MAG: hemerythrin domain-containing protein, partial [Gammaproteobacteria bacterium]